VIDMTKQSRALQMAINALTNCSRFEEAIQACEEALEQPAQEPVAWMHRHAGEITEFNDFQSCQYCEPLYTHPAPSWQGLSNDMVRAIGEKCEEKNRGILNWIDFYNAIESMLKEKNYEQH